MGSTDGIAGAIWCFFVPIALTFVAFSIVGPSVAIAMARDYVANCSQAVVELDVWLDVYGGVSIGSIVYVILAVIAVTMCLRIDSGFSSVLIVVTPLLLFHLGWAIVGSVGWSDWQDCAANQTDVWKTGQAMVIIEWLTVVAVLIGLCIAGTIKFVAP